jgi:hypothetical protein
MPKMVIGDSLCQEKGAGVITMPAMAKKKKKRVGVPLTIWIDRRIREALDKYIENTDPEVTLKAVAEKSFRDFLATVGHWPPPGHKD